MNSFYSIRELRKLGLRGFGSSVRISRFARFYSPEKIVVGNNVRIDDFCILSGDIKIGNNVHIAAGSKLYGEGGIEFGDYSGCSANCTIYSATDDFSGEYMVGAVLPDSVKNVVAKKVVLEKYTQLGANTVVMPGVVVHEGAVTGAMSFIKEDLDAWTINGGIPTQVIKKRSDNLLKQLSKDGLDDNI